jgi:hypothetical protein
MVGSSPLQPMKDHGVVHEDDLMRSWWHGCWGSRNGGNDDDGDCSNSAGC